MEYFKIDEKSRYHVWEDLQQQPGFSGKLNTTEMFQILEEQLRPKGLQPYISPDMSGFEIQPASKKFLEQRGAHNRSISKRAKAYMAFCEEMP